MLHVVIVRNLVSLGSSSWRLLRGAVEGRCLVYNWLKARAIRPLCLLRATRCRWTKSLHLEDILM
jgi:hypothetical protein